MKVRKAMVLPTPEYPNRKEFQQYQHLLGATVLGIGLAVSGCSKKTSGVPRAVGEAPYRPTKVESTPRLMGDVMQIPKPEAPPVRLNAPTRLPGEIMPPPPPGVPPPPPSPAQPAP